MLISHPDAYRLVIDAFTEIIEKKGKFKFDFLAGTATAGIPWAAFLAYERKVPMIYVRSKPKMHGAEKMVEGDLPVGRSILVVEDLISTGGSSVRTVEVLRKEGWATVTDVIAIFSYNFEKARIEFENAKAKAWTVTNVQTLTDIAVEMGKITKEEQAMVLEFTKDPDGWQKLWA